MVKGWRAQYIMHYGIIFGVLVLFWGCFAQEEDDGSGTREDGSDTWGNLQVF